jgi:hypothetical protein
MLLQPSQASKILIELGLMVALTLGLNDTNWLLRFKGLKISEDRMLVSGWTPNSRLSFLPNRGTPDI